MKKIKEIGGLFWECFWRWRANNPTLIAAGLSFFTLFSLAPLLLLLLATIGLLFHGYSGQDLILDKIADIAGPVTAKSFSVFLDVVGQGSRSATVFSLLLLLWGGARIFTQMETALNLIGDKGEQRNSEPKRRWQRLAKTAFARFRALTMVFALGVVMFGFFVLDITMAAVANVLGDVLPSTLLTILLPLASYALSIVLFATMFSLVYKWLPRSELRWSATFAGGLVASLLFAAARYVISLYFRYSNLESLYGIFGSVIIILFWVYFSMQILLFGAEFAWTLSRHRARATQPGEVSAGEHHHA